MLRCCSSLRPALSAYLKGERIRSPYQAVYYSSRRSRFNEDNGSSQGHKLTLEHFVLRSKFIKLYRDFLRATRNIPNPEARRQTVDWLRDEHFEGSTGLKYEYDLTRIKELLVYGSVALKRICGPMELAAAVNPRHGSFPKLRGSRVT